MKILIISQYFFPENLRINDLCEGLKEKGHEISVLTGKPNYPDGNFYKGYNFFNKLNDNYKGIRVYRSPVIPRGSSSGFRLFINYLSFTLFGLFRLLFIKNKFDRIFVYAPSPITVGYLGAFASLIFKAKPFLWVHDLWPESVKEAGGVNNKLVLSLIDSMTRSIYHFYPKILVQSPRFKEYLINQKVNINKITYYPYYAEEFYKVVKTNRDIQSKFPDGLNILFAGNIGVAQNFDTIINAAKIIDKKINKFTFMILGDGRDMKRILNKIKNLSIENRFKFIGRHPPEKMPYYFSSADALLVSLKKSKIFELTIPGKLQSYLACGKPIIASIDGITAQIINDANCGLTSPSDDYNSLAKSIILFSKLSDYDRMEMGKRSLDVYEKEFERNKLLNKLIDIFER